MQRGGPGLGGIQPSQADYWQATRATGHGDFHILVFAPATIQEMVDLVYTAYDKADEYRMPAMILADGVLGQMMEPVEFPDSDPSANIPAKDWALTGHHNARKHNVVNSLFLQPQALEDLVVERYKKYDYIKIIIFFIPFFLLLINTSYHTLHNPYVYYKSEVIKSHHQH